MTAYVALLRAVNVGGTGKLAMRDLAAICEAAAFTRVRTYIASGNVVFRAKSSEAVIKRELETALQIHAGKPVGVIVRTARQIADVLARNPFPETDAKGTVAIFLDAPPPADTLASAKGRAGERIALGIREIYIDYRGSMARSKLRIPAAAQGTARNMNTIAKLAVMAAD